MFEVIPVLKMLVDQVNSWLENLNKELQLIYQINIP